MPKIIWSELALSDIKSIHHYIARDAINRASLFIERLIEATDQLESCPHRGRIIEEIGREECRELIYASYRIMYEVKGDDGFEVLASHAGNVPNRDFLRTDCFTLRVI